MRCDIDKFLDNLITYNTYFQSHSILNQLFAVVCLRGDVESNE